MTRARSTNSSVDGGGGWTNRTMRSFLVRGLSCLLPPPPLRLLLFPFVCVDEFGFLVVDKWRTCLERKQTLFLVAIMCVCGQGDGHRQGAPCTGHSKCQTDCQTNRDLDPEESNPTLDSRHTSVQLTSTYPLYSYLKCSTCRLSAKCGSCTRPCSQYRILEYWLLYAQRTHAK